MLELELATQFKRDLKKITKQGKRRTLLDSIVEQLQKEGLRCKKEKLYKKAISE